MAVFWHRQVSMSLTRTIGRLGVEVCAEIEVGMQSQRVDIVLLLAAKTPLGPGAPTGLDNLAEHNLISFKSFREALTEFAIIELLSYGVLYCKSKGPPRQELPRDKVRLIAVSVRRPEQLMAGKAALRPVSPGVYDMDVLGQPIRVLVLNEMQETEENIPWILLTGDAEKVRRCVDRLKYRLDEWRAPLVELFEFYKLDNIPMPITVAEIEQEVEQRVIRRASVEARLEGLTPEDLLKCLTPEDLLKRLTTEERLKGLPLAELEAYLKRRRQEMAQQAPETPE